jgi:hypothetical protein
MKLAKTLLLIVLLFLPVITIFIFDARYGQFQASVCTSTTDIEVLYTCRYPERNERDRIVTTAFYRHIADYFGRRDGTSPSFLDEASNKYGNYELKHRIGEFNRSFAISMTVSVAFASVAGTLLTQNILSAYRHRKRHSDSKS